MRSRHLALLGLVSAVSAGVACSTAASNVGSSADNHTAGELLTLNDSHVWAQASDADFAKGIGGGPAAAIARTDPATKRLDQWLDRYHTILGDMLTARGERLAAPKPNAALFKSSGPNAFVSGAVVCPTGWTLRSTATDNPRTGPSFMLSATSASVTDMTTRCLQPQNWTDPTTFATFWNGLSPACTVSTSGNDLTVSPTDSCRTFGTEGGFTTMATASTIGVTLESISWGEEIRVALTLAHELGHYYRAHTNPNVRKRLGFFYKDTPDGPELPVPVAESEQYEQMLMNIRRVPVASPLRAVTKYSRRLAKTVVALKAFCPSAELDEAALTAIKNGRNIAGLSQRYYAYETSIANCTAGLSLADAETKTKLDTILREQGIMSTLAEGATTIGEALAIMTTKLDAIDADEKMLLAKINNGGLGWYTDEQEADEIGLELATRAGFTTDDLIKARLRTHEQYDVMYKNMGGDSGEIVDYATCKKWVDAGFTEVGADGVSHPIRAPLGSLSDTHHESCYRTYNLWLEAKKHAYPVTAPMPAFTPAWSELQAHVVADLGATPPPTPKAPATDAGAPASDAGAAEPPAPPPAPIEEPTLPKKKPKPEEPAATPYTPPAPSTPQGCSAAPGTTGSSGAVLGFLTAIALVLVRRRR